MGHGIFRAGIRAQQLQAFVDRNLNVKGVLKNTMSDRASEPLLHAAFAPAGSLRGGLTSG